MEDQSDYSPRDKRFLLDGMLSWIQHRPRTIIGVLIMFIIGLLHHWLGFWDTFVLIILVAIGYVVGRYMDERKEVGKVLDRLFTSDQ